MGERERVWAREPAGDLTRCLPEVAPAPACGRGPAPAAAGLPPGTSARMPARRHPAPQIMGARERVWAREPGGPLTRCLPEVAPAPARLRGGGLAVTGLCRHLHPPLVFRAGVRDWWWPCAKIPGIDNKDFCEA